MRLIYTATRTLKYVRTHKKVSTTGTMAIQKVVQNKDGKRYNNDKFLYFCKVTYLTPLVTSMQKQNFSIRGSLGRATILSTVYR